MLAVATDAHGSFSLLGRRTALSICERALVQDAEGFDDIDAFWEAATTANLEEATTLQLVVARQASTQTPAAKEEQTWARQSTERRTPLSSEEWSPDVVVEEPCATSANRTSPLPRFTLENQMTCSDSGQRVRGDDGSPPIADDEEPLPVAVQQEATKGADDDGGEQSAAEDCEEPAPAASTLEQYEEPLRAAEEHEEVRPVEEYSEQAPPAAEDCDVSQPVGESNGRSLENEEPVAEDDEELAAEDDEELAAEDDEELAVEDDEELVVDDDEELVAEDDEEPGAEDDEGLGAEEEHDAIDVPNDEPKLAIEPLAYSNEEQALSSRQLIKKRVDAEERRPDNADVRRSKRVKYPVLRHWKNERLVYSLDSETKAPKVVAVQLGVPTPHAASEAKKRMRRAAAVARAPEFECDDTGEVATIWDHAANESKSHTVVARSSSRLERRLPVSSHNRRPDAVVGLAAQGFKQAQLEVGDLKLSPFISGHVTLPPNAVKDEESVGPCAQVFFVANCQRAALELALAKDPFGDFQPDQAKRFLLSAGDQFHVPPFNVYRLENLSYSTDAHLYWLIVQPLEEGAPAADVSSPTSQALIRSKRRHSPRAPASGVDSRQENEPLPPREADDGHGS